MAVALIKLSASTDGQGSLINSSYTTIHTTDGSTGASQWDQIFLFATNTHTAPVSVTVGWGGTTEPNFSIVKSYVLPVGSGMVAIVPGTILHNSNVISAKGSVAFAILITGYVNRYT